MFTYGDIVKRKFGSNGVEYFIVTDVADFSKKNDGSDMNYEVMRMFPVSQVSTVSNIDGIALEIVAEVNTKSAQLILEFAKKKRSERGWVGTPDYIAHIYHNKNASGVMKKRQTVSGRIEIAQSDDCIRYDLLETIDECLDRMNDLQDLYNLFGDEAYLVLRQVVQDRLKQLI